MTGQVFSKTLFLLFLFFLMPDLIIYYVSAVLGLPCCVGFYLVAVHRLLIAVASLVVEHRLSALRL